MKHCCEPTHQPDPRSVSSRFEEELAESRDSHNWTFAWVLAIQWIAGVVFAGIFTPLTWTGDQSSIHPHLIAATLLGGIVSLYPVYRVFSGRGGTGTRYSIAIAQVLMSGLLIHLTGGRIETHFHVFASLAFLAFYRDIGVLVVAASVVFADHLIRGIFWPQSVFGIDEPWPVLRAFEHTGWVIAEVTVLAFSIRRSHREMRENASRQITLENTENILEQRVEDRTRALKASETQARDRFDNAVVGLYHCSPDGRLLGVNPVMATMLGYDSGESLMLEVGSPDELLVPADRSTRSWHDQVLVRNGYIHRDSQWKHRDGKAVTVRESTKLIHADDGRLLSIEGSVEDLTELKEMEGRYLQSQKVQALGQLSAGVAHDFNNILTSILGFSELVLSSPDTSSEIAEQVSEIRKSAEKAGRLTAQLLAFSRKQTFLPKNFDLGLTVEDMSGLIRRLAGERIHLDFKYMAQPTPVRADASQIQQVILNLAVNARDAMPDGGLLTVCLGREEFSDEFVSFCGVAEPGRYVVLSVSDTGCGIAPDVRERIFEPFFTTKGDAGTGLGLATCIGIVKQSGGHITFDTTEGVGTTFHIYLPEVEAPAREEVAPTDPAPACHLTPGHGVVLLVEDEEMVRRLGVRALTKLGYRVIEAKNGEEGIEKFLHQSSEDPIELVVTDVMMPVMGGIELVKRVKEVSPSTPVIYCSGYSDESLSEEELARDGRYFLQKPYSLESLGQRIHEALQLAAA